MLVLRSRSTSTQFASQASQAVLHPGARNPGARASQPVHYPPDPAATAGSVKPQARHTQRAGGTCSSSICGPDNIENSNPYLGKVVVIIEGAHKGRQGRLCHFGNDGMLKIENPNAWVREVVEVEHDHCRLLDIVNSDALDEYRKKAGEKFKIIRSVDDNVETSSVAARAVAEDPARTTAASAFVPGRSEGELLGDGWDVDVNDLGEDEQLQRAFELSRKSWEKERIGSVSIGSCHTSNLTVDDTKVCQPTEEVSLEEYRGERTECNIPKAANLTPKTHIADKVCTPFSSLPLPSGDGIGERFVQERENPHHSYSRKRGGRICLDPAETRPPRKRSFQTNKIGPSGGEEEPKIEHYSVGTYDSATTKRAKRSLQSSIHFTSPDHAPKKQTKTFSFTNTKGGQETKQPATGRRLRSSKRIREEASTIRSTSSKANIASPDEVRKDQQLQEATKQPATGRRLRSSKRIREEASTIRSTSSKANIASPAEEDKDADDDALPADEDNNTQRSSREQPSKNTLNKESRRKSYSPDQNAVFDNNCDRGIARDSDSDNGEESSFSDVSKDELEELGCSIDEILGMETKICDVIESFSLQKKKSKTLSTQLKLVRFLRNASKEKGPALLISRYSGVDSIFAAIRAFPTSLELLIVAIEGLWNMCFYDKGTWRPDLEIYPDLLDLMKRSTAILP